MKVRHIRWAEFMISINLPQFGFSRGVAYLMPTLEVRAGG